MRFSARFRIGDRLVGPGAPAYVIAEMSGNHNQDFEQSLRILRAAKEAGADAIKIQTYTADTLTIQSDAPYFRIGGTVWHGRTLYDLYGDASTPWEWQPRLQAAAADLGLGFFSTPFDRSAVEFLEGLRVPAYKIASFEAVDLDLLAAVAATGKPVIVSTGMCTLAEIDEAVRTVAAHGGTQLALLKCVSAYPAPAVRMHLRTIPHLADAYGVPVGLSDHTLDVAVPVAAVALGASVIEKHLCLDRALGGPDSSFSLTPAEFRAMVAAVRTAEQATGEPFYGVTPEEEESIVFRRSLFVVQDVRAGDPFTPANVRSIRPGHGLHPRYLPTVLGRAATCDLRRGTPLRLEHVGGAPHPA